MDSVKFPDGARYQSCLAPNVVDGRANNRKYFPTHSGSFSYNGTNEIRIEVTADRGAMLNSSLGYLEFNIAATHSNVTLDCGAWSWIDEMAIISDGQDIERITSYNLLHSVLTQYTSNMSHLIQQNALSGSIYALNTTVSFDSTAASNVFHGTNIDAMKSTGGNGNYDPFLSETITATESKTFCIPLISGFLGSGLYIPVGESRGFTLSLRLAQTNNIGRWSAAHANNAYTISAITYNAPIVMIEDSVFRNAFNQMLRSDNSNAVCWRGDTYKHYISALTGSSDQTVIINDRSRSLRAMFCVLRTTNTSISGAQRFSLSTRTITNINKFQIRIGDVLYPQSQIDIKCNAIESGAVAGRSDVQGRYKGSKQDALNVSRAYAEVAKIFGMLHNTSSGGLVSLDAYCSDEGLGVTTAGIPNTAVTVDHSALTHYGVGILGVNLESYEQDSGVSGIDTARNNLNVTLLFNIQNGTFTYQVDTFSKIHAVYRLDATGTFSVSQ